MSWFARVLFHERRSTERRSTERQRAPRLAAYYWNGAHAAPHRVRDISSTGLYLLTEERWHPGTVLMITLQKTDTDADARFSRSIRMQAKVVRWGDDGVGLTFLFTTKESPLADGADRKAFIAFSQSLGQSLYPRENPVF
jgi:hypothetical protein